MTSPELAGVVLRHGRHAVGPVVERLLVRLDELGLLVVPDPGRAFRDLFGLVVQDTQIRVLLGEGAPSRAELRRQATHGVDHFWSVYAPGSGEDTRRKRA